MLRMTKQTDYGIVLMTHLAQAPAGQFSAPELAQLLRIPPPMVSKILKLLARDGLLVSHRGVRGDLRLNDDGGYLGIDPGGQEQSGDFPDLGPQLGRVLVNCYCM
jgi:Mn-dependent DtxR family transcriptional regulator